MTSGKRVIWILTMVAFLVATSGCAGTSLRRVEDEIVRNGTGIHEEKGQSIDGYLLHDGTMAEYKGWVRLAAQDSLIFWSETEASVMRDPGGEGEEALAFGPVLPKSAVKALDVKEKRVGRTVLLVAGIIVVVGLAVMAFAYPKETVAEAATGAF